MKLRSHLTLLVLVSVAPLSVFSGFLVWQDLTAEADVRRTGTRDTVRALSLAIDRELRASFSVLDTLAAGRQLAIAAITGTRLDDHALVRTLVQRAKRFGFTTAALIHPSHVALAHAAFVPDDAAFEQAAGLIVAMAEAEASGQGAVRFEGKMVDYAMLPRARLIVDVRQLD